MKRFNYLLGMLAVAATFTACSSDDVVQNSDKTLNGDKYMAVSIMSSNGATRATSNDDFDPTTDAESKISNLTFFFYDASGNFITQGEQYGATTTNATTQGDDEYNWVSHIADAVVALKSNEKSSNITQVLAVVNYANAASDFVGKSLTQAKELLAEEANMGDTNNGFIMTNSTYVDGSNVKTTAAVTSDDFYDTPDEAKKAPVDIYVERLAAKVTVKNTIETSTLSDLSVSGTTGTPTLSVEIVGWALNATAPQSYLIKKVENENYFTDWNETAKHRSYWAIDPHYAGASTTYPTNGFVDDTAPLTYVQYKNITTSTSPMYCFENTYDEATFSKYLQASTSLLVLAKLKVDNSTDDLVKYNGDLYTIDSYKNVILSTTVLGNYYKLVENKYTQIDANDLKVDNNANGATLVDGKVCLQLDATKTAGVTWKKYKGSGDKESADSYTDATAAEINTYLAGITLQGYGFKGGLMFYSIPIKHLVDRTGDDDVATPTKIGQYGVVRNHIYSIELTGVSGIGHAIWNPDEHIVPTEETMYYLGAKLHVLSWRIVPTQKVVLK